MRRLLAMALLCFACRSEVPLAPEDPVEWSVEASTDKDRVQVGEDLNLSLRLRHPAGGEFVAPPASAFSPFEVIGRSEEKVSPVETLLHYRLAAYQLPADLEIPALEIAYRNEGEVATLATRPIPVELVTSLSPDVTDIHDIKDPLELNLPRDPSLLWWLLLALAAAALAYLIYRKLRKDAEPATVPAWAPPPPPPDVEAEAALRRLAEKKLVERGEIAAFYTELSEIVRRYSGRRFEVPYLERTSREVLFDLAPKRIPADATADLRAILESSDLVKFAKLMPEASEAQESFARALSWLEKTRPRAPVESPESLEATA